MEKWRISRAWHGMGMGLMLDAGCWMQRLDRVPASQPGGQSATDLNGILNPDRPWKEAYLGEARWKGDFVGTFIRGSISELARTRDSWLTNAWALCSRAKARFVYLLPLCSLSMIVRCCLEAPRCSLAACSKAARLPFPNRNGNPQS